MPELFVNDINPQTTLATTTTTSATSWTVSSSTGWPAVASPNFVRVRIEPATADGTFEIVTLTNISGTTWTVTRAQESTTGVAWVSGAKIAPVITKATLDSLGVWGQELDLATEWTTTQPTTPATGLTLFARAKARRLLNMLGPSGLDTPIQPALFANRVGRLTAINNSTAPSLSGLAVTYLHNATATPAAVAMASTNFYTSIVRVRMQTTAVAGVGCGVRSSTAQWFLSSTANMGGFFFVCRFGLNAITATNRGFIGLSATTAALSPTVNPSTLFNSMGLAWDSTDTTQMYFQSSPAASAATRVALGTNFRPQVAATDYYEFRMFSPSGGGQTVNYSIERLNDGSFAQGTFNTTAAMPALNLILAAHVHYSNGTTAAAGGVDLTSLYVETDN